MIYVARRGIRTAMATMPHKARNPANVVPSRDAGLG